MSSSSNFQILLRILSIKDKNVFINCYLKAENSHIKYCSEMKLPVFLPKSKFQAQIKGIERSALDTKLAQMADLSGFYCWQRNQNLQKIEDQRTELVSYK